MKKIWLLGIFLSIVACNGQKEKTNKTEKKQILKKQTMEKFDIISFNKHQENGEWNYTDNEGNKYRDWKDFDRGYVQEIKNKKNIFDIYKYFHIDGVLAQEGIEFHGGGFNNGIWKDYNEKGEITKQVDYDIPYKNYPWEKVEAYLQSRKVDLKDNFTRVWREENNEGTFWMISWDAEKLSNIGTKTINNIVIDVKTGKVIKEYTTIYKDN